MKNKMLVLVLLTILFASCAGISELSRGYYVRTQVNKFDGCEEFQQRFNRNPGGQVLGIQVKMDALNLRVRKYTDGTKQYAIIAYVERGKWFSIQHVPLEIKADEKIFKFLFIATTSNVLDSNTLQEWGYYLIDIESINEIMKAEKVIGKLYGKNGFITIEYRPIVFERWRKFLYEYDK